MAKYMTPDFDVTLFEIKEEITNTIGGEDQDAGWGSDELSSTGGSDWDV